METNDIIFYNCLDITHTDNYYGNVTSVASFTKDGLSLENLVVDNIVIENDCSLDIITSKNSIASFGKDGLEVYNKLIVDTIVFNTDSLNIKNEKSNIASFTKDGLKINGNQLIVDEKDIMKLIYELKSEIEKLKSSLKV